jgi:hypothetical protein
MKSDRADEAPPEYGTHLLMVNIIGSIYIDRPPEVVFDFVADERNEPLYNPKMTAVSVLTEESIGVGSRFEATLMARGRPITMTVEFTEFVRPRRLASVTTTGRQEVTPEWGQQEEPTLRALQSTSELAVRPGPVHPIKQDRLRGATLVGKPERIVARR